MRRRKEFLFILKVTHYADSTGTKYSHVFKARHVKLTRKIDVITVYENMWAEINKELGENANAIIDWWSVTPVRGR